MKDHYKINQEEVFGPFVVIDKFKTQEEAITRANCTSYGLGAAVFTKDITRAHKVAAKLESGMVWINRWFYIKICSTRVTLTGFYNAVPTTATMLFRLGKIFFLFSFHFFFPYPFGQSTFLAIGGQLAYFHQLGFAFQPPLHGMSDWVMLEIIWVALVPAGDKKQRMGTARTSCPVDSPAPLFVAPSALQAADCQIPGLLNLRLLVSALYDVALCCRKRIALTVTLEYKVVSSNLVSVENSDSMLYRRTRTQRRCMVSCKKKPLNSFADPG